MHDQYEVLTRRICDIQECKQGRIPMDNAQLPWDHCHNCDGTGYVKEWIDVRTLIQQVINVG